LKENPAPVKARPFGKMYYPALDGMRGLAILLVIVYHNFSFIKFAHWGWSGVDLFFVLSGFLITEILIKTVDHHHYFKNFYAKRALRILPLYYLSLGLAIWILPGIVGRPDIFTYYKRNQLWLWLFLQNWLYIFKQPESHGFLGHLWSLAIEEQFYLIWPVVVVALRKPKYLLLFISCLILLTFGLRLYVWFHKTNSLSYYYFYSLSRYDAIWIGCSVALIQRIDSALLSRNVKWIVLTLVCLNLFFVFIKQYWGISLPFFALAGYLTLAILFGLLIQEGSHGNSVWIRKIFTNAGLLFL
jgi:peptidoglycan/LPS O-acetylase OafA/YrhL